jgi:hypothetical protein
MVIGIVKKGKGKNVVFVPKTHHMKALDMSLCVNKNQSGCGGK